MDFFQLKSQQIPKGYCVIKVENSYKYLHFDSGHFYFREKMHGCFVTSIEVADEIIIHIDRAFPNKYSLNKVDFDTAYEEHGIIEKQIFYN